MLVPDPFDAGAHGDEKARQILHMRLGGAVAQDGRAFGGNGSAERIFPSP
jgi:hypothetical protein